MYYLQYTYCKKGKKKTLKEKDMVLTEYLIYVYQHLVFFIVVIVHKERMHDRVFSAL